MGYSRHRVPEKGDRVILLPLREGYKTETGVVVGYNADKDIYNVEVDSKWREWPDDDGIRDVPGDHVVCERTDGR